MKNIKNILFTAFMPLFMILYACTDHFEELNTPPTSVTVIDPAFTFSEAIRDDNISYNYEWINSRLFGGWAQHWADNDEGDGIPNYYDPHRRNDDEFWVWTYQTVLKNLERTQALLLDQTEGGETAPEIRNKLAITRIYEVIPFERLTAGVGDIPFSEGAKGMEGFVTPIYDLQSEIYPALLTQLNVNIERLDPSDISFGNADLIYQGNVDSWIRFGNSIKLRTAMRMRSADPVAAQEAVTQAMQSPLISSHGQSAMLATVANMGPGENAHPITREMRQPADKSRPGKQLVDMLKEKNDPRLTLIVEPTEASKKIFDQTGDLSDLEYIGIQPNMTSEQYDNMDLEKRSFVALDVWANEDRSVPVHILTYAEVLFLQAEAALMGWGGTEADAQTFYEDGIRAALIMEPYNITDITVIENYVASQTPLTGTFEDMLAQIMEQKYITLFSRGMEAYYEWRRTGYPILDPGTRTNNSTNGQIPRRAYYHQQEQSLNRENFQTAVSRQGEDHPLTSMWIDPE
ncbi:MAG: SusD/RagB family nutrient-binding outer membrane lipoprotein [Anditalea sp.]